MIFKYLKIISNKILRNIERKAAVKHGFISQSDLSHLPGVTSNIWFGQVEEPVHLDISENIKRRNQCIAYSTNNNPNRRFACEVEDCYVMGRSACGMLRNGNIITETVSGDQGYALHRINDTLGLSIVSDLFYYQFNKSEQPDIKYSNIFPLVPFYKSYYSPWLTEYLPKLRGLQIYEQQTGNTPCILIAKNPPKFVLESLSLLGYDSNRLIQWDRKKARADKLIFTNHRLMVEEARRLYEYNPSYYDLIWVKRGLKNSINCDKKKTPSRIYVSRQQAHRGRSIINFEDIKPMLDAWGFESFVFESLSLRKQIRIFANADVIMGPHGAGLTNMIFSENPTVIELLPKDQVRASFALLSGILNYDYEGIVLNTNDKNHMYVDIEELNSYLDSILTD